MNSMLLEILVCPICKGPLIHDKNKKELICKFDRLAYPVHNDVPIMLADKARELSSEEIK